MFNRAGCAIISIGVRRLVYCSHLLSIRFSDVSSRNVGIFIVFKLAIVVEVDSQNIKLVVAIDVNHDGIVVINGKLCKGITRFVVVGNAQYLHIALFRYRVWFVRRYWLWMRALVTSYIVRLVALRALGYGLRLNGFGLSGFGLSRSMASGVTSGVASGVTSGVYINHLYLVVLSRCRARPAEVLSEGSFIFGRHVIPFGLIIGMVYITVPLEGTTRAYLGASRVEGFGKRHIVVNAMRHWHLAIAPCGHLFAAICFGTINRSAAAEHGGSCAKGYACCGSAKDASYLRALLDGLCRL